jgi:ribosomal protein S7
MYDGKRGTSQTIIYNSFKIIEDKTKKPAIDVFATAINNIMPEVELKVRRIGAANYQVPVEVTPERKQTLGLRWLVTYARLRNEKTMEEKLLAKSSMPPMAPATLSRRRKMCIRWRKPTRLTRTTAGKGGTYGQRRKND